MSRMIARSVPFLLALSLIVSASGASSAQIHDLASEEVTSATVDTANRWQRTTPLPEIATTSHARATLARDHVYIFTPTTGDALSKSTGYASQIAEDGSLGAWELANTFDTERGGDYAIATVDDYIVVTGGATGAPDELPTSIGHVSLDGTIISWTDGPPLTTNRMFHVVVSHGKHIYVIGGYDGSAVARFPVEVSQIGDNGILEPWVETTAPLEPRAEASAAVVDGYIYLFGGTTYGAYLSTIERARILENGGLAEWEVVGDNPISPNSTSIGLVTWEGKLVQFGGYSADSGTLDTVAISDLVTHDVPPTWSHIQSMTVGRTWFQYAVTGSRVYVLGGSMPGGWYTRSTEWIDLSAGVTPPIDSHRVSINEGALFTNQISVTLSIEAPASVAEMMVSNDGGFSGAGWQPYAESVPWQITQYGVAVIPRVVYARFRTFEGIESATFQDDIILDVTAPEGTVTIESPESAAFDQNVLTLPAAVEQLHAVYLPISTCISCVRNVPTPTAVPTLSPTPVPTAVPAPATVTLRLSAQDDASGVAQMQVSNSNDFAGASWETYVKNKAWQVPSGDETTVYVRFVDNAGNVSEPVHDTITLP